MSANTSEIEPPPKPLRPRLNLWAILLGSFVDVAATTVLEILIIAVFGGRFVYLFLVSGASMTALGGYVAAAVAGRRSLAHGLGVGLLSTLAGLALSQLGGDSSGSPIVLPDWFTPIGFALTVPAGILGAWVRRRFWRERSEATTPRSGVYPNAQQAVWLVLLFIFITAGFGVAAGLLIAFGLEGNVAALRWGGPIVAAGVALGYALVLAGAARKARAPARELFPLKLVGFATLWPALATSVGLAILFAELSHLIRRAYSVPSVPIDPNIFGGLETGFWATVFLIVIVAPVAEEFLFRGVILRGFLSRYTTRKAILASSILFGIVHLSPGLILIAVALGVLFAWWRVNTGSLMLPLLGHSVHNTLALGLPRLDWVNAAAAIGIEEGFFQPLWFDAVGVFLFLFGILQFRRISGSRAERSEATPLPPRIE